MQGHALERGILFRAGIGAEDVESRPKIGRRGQPLQAREPMPGAEDAESMPTRVSKSQKYTFLLFILMTKKWLQS